MGRPAKEWVGKRKGKLLVLARTGSRGTSPLYLVRCDCGTEKEVTSAYLKGASISCGCHRAALKSRLRHGHSPKNGKSRTYRAWVSMRSRCSKPDNGSYERYGALGIRVCDEWDSSFDAFLRDVGEAPSKDHTIDRIDPTGNYEPSNCRWLTKIEQVRSSRRTQLDLDKAKIIKESSLGNTALARALGVSISAVRGVKRGHTWKDA
jgi:hypothetical protein